MYKETKMLSENYKQKLVNSINERFKEMGIDDEETLNELNQESINSLESELNKVENILNSDDLSELGFHTHTIKGVLLNAGLESDANKFKVLSSSIDFFQAIPTGAQVALLLKVISK
jgi:hypothetical protein